MTGPPRNDKIVIHISGTLSKRTQAGDHRDDGNAEQDAPRRSRIANRSADLILEVWITQSIGNGIEALHGRTRKGEAIAPRDRKRVEAAGFNAPPHDQRTTLSALLRAAALASRFAISAWVPFSQTLILGHEKIEPT